MRPLSITHSVAARLAPTVLASAFLACSGSPSGTDDTNGRTPSTNQGIIAGALEVKVDRTARTLTLRNTTEFEVGYMVIEKEMMVIALIPPCGEQCPTLVQGATTPVNYSAIAGYHAQATEARVLWWTYRRNADGTRTVQSAVRTIAVSL